MHRPARRPGGSLVPVHVDQVGCQPADRLDYSLVRAADSFEMGLRSHWALAAPTCRPNGTPRGHSRLVYFGILSPRTPPRIRCWSILGGSRRAPGRLVVNEHFMRSESFHKLVPGLRSGPSLLPLQRTASCMGPRGGRNIGESRRPKVSGIMACVLP